MGKRQGSLSCSVNTTTWSARCTASVYWEGERGEHDDCKGLVALPSALQLYHRQKYINISPRRSGDADWTPSTDEDHVYFDAESDPKYDNNNPGTVTVEGYGLECWNYEELYGTPHSQTILSNASHVPNITAPKLLRRLRELKMDLDLPLNTWNRLQDYEDLSEFGGSLGITYVDPNRKYEVGDQISNLYMMLNRRDIWTSFTQTSSIGLAAHRTDEGPTGLWNFLWQMILGRELARRLKHYPADTSMTGFTAHVLGTLIVADVWVRNVDMVLVAAKDDEAKKKTSDGNEGGEGADREGKGVDEEGESADGGEKMKGEGRDDNSEEEQLGVRDAPFTLKNRDLQMHSLVHESQVDGLLHFAQTISWPYLSEARETAPKAYHRMRNGETIPIDLWDWLYGTTLPGKWAAFKIMAALVLVSPSIASSVRVADYFENGLSLSQCSYWRSRTVLGRVLGGLTGVRALCGWIGPCPPLDGADTHGKYIRLKAQPVAPPPYDRNTIYIDSSNVGGWLTPSPPPQRKTKCTVEKILVEPLPLDHGDSGESSRQYLASVVFKITTSESKAPLSVKFTLHHNPVFITPPRCKGAHPGIVGGHQHTVHPWGLIKFHKNVWNIEELATKGLDVDVSLGRAGRVVIINATGEGMETLARAWCAEKGKSAVIRRSSGPCFVCAWNVACGQGLGVNVLIWVS